MTNAVAKDGGKVKGRSKKVIDQELVDEFKEMLEERGYENSQSIIDVFTNTGICKKSMIFGIRELRGPIVQFVYDDGRIEYIEKARPGLLFKDVDGEEMRYILDPKKMHTFPNAVGEPLRGWILFESDAFSQPVDPVYDATVFNNIMIQGEAQQRLDEVRMRALDIKKWGTIGFILFITAAVIMTNLDKLPGLINQIWGTGVVEETAKNIVENASQNITRLTGGP